jgi:hypothetical protein
MTKQIEYARRLLGMFMGCESGLWMWAIDAGYDKAPTVSIFRTQWVVEKTIRMTTLNCCADVPSSRTYEHQC